MNTFHSIPFTVRYLENSLAEVSYNLKYSTNKTLFSQSSNSFSFCLKWALTIKWLKIKNLQNSWKVTKRALSLFNIIFSFLLVIFTKNLPLQCDGTEGYTWKRNIHSQIISLAIKLHSQPQAQPELSKLDRYDQKASGRGWLSKNDLNNTSDLSGCENGASCDAPLIVAKERILP